MIMPVRYLFCVLNLRYVPSNANLYVFPGPCYPCPLTSKVSCHCGKTSITVVCGKEKRTKPPRWSYFIEVLTPLTKCGASKFDEFSMSSHYFLSGLRWFGM